jgi:hypothetical protein
MSTERRSASRTTAPHRTTPTSLSPRGGARSRSGGGLGGCNFVRLLSAAGWVQGRSSGASCLRTTRARCSSTSSRLAILICHTVSCFCGVCATCLQATARRERRHRGAVMRGRQGGPGRGRHAPRAGQGLGVEGGAQGHHSRVLRPRVA